MKKLLGSLLAAILLSVPTAGATLSCTVSPTCSDTKVMNLYSSTGGHAELSSGSTYTNIVCCNGVTGLGNSCSGNYDVVASLSGTTNAHIEQNTQANYVNDVCLSVASGTVTIAYQSTNCTGYDTTVASMSGTTNAHVGDSTAYTTKICASIAAAQTLSFSISDNSIGFGTLGSGAARYATGDTTGSASQVEAHTLSVSTNATNGYTVTIQGATLTSGGASIAAIGGTNTASSAGTEQFGLRASVTSGTGTVSSPYASTGFAYAADASTSSTVATGTGDSSTSVYSMRYLANIAADTDSGDYSATLNYIATANF